MTTWRQDAAQIIHEGTKHLPPETPLDLRIDVVRKLMPHSWKQVSWGKKAWHAARRDYLVPFGYEPKTKQAKQLKAEGLPLFGDTE